MNNPYEAPKHSDSSYSSEEWESVTDRPAIWPKHLGTICLIMGILATVGALIQLVSTFIVPVISSATSNAGGDGGAFSVIEGHLVYFIFLHLLTLILGIGLCVCAYGFMTKKAWIGSIIHIWAAGKVFLAILTTVINVLIAEQNVQLIIDTNPFIRDLEDPHSFMLAAQYVGLLFGVFYTSALPIFFFIFMRDSKVKQEVRSWSGLKPA